MLNRPLPWTVCIIITLVAGCGGYPSNTTDTTLVTPSVDVTPSPQLIVSADPTHTLPTVFMDSSGPVPTLTKLPVSTPSPTPESIDMPEGFDLDVRPVVGVSHNSPEIARSDETVTLAFNFTCAAPGIPCGNPTLLFTYGYSENKEFTPVQLRREIIDETEYWAVHLPALDAEGGSLRYYLQWMNTQGRMIARYPVEGTIDVFTVSEFIPVKLPKQKAVQPGELALSLPWGSGPEAVGIQQREGYPLKEGPVAIGVAEDGRIAVSDHVNGRILIFDPINQSFSSVPLPFEYVRIRALLQFDRDGQLAILDPVGKPIDSSEIKIPQLYRVNGNGSIQEEAPVFAAYPAKLTEDLEVLDDGDGRWISLLGPDGRIKSREEQRHKHAQQLPYRFVENMDPYVARFGDTDANIAFEIQSVSPLGAIIDFEKYTQGYAAIFYGDLIRAVWFDPSGNVLKDVTMPNDQYSEVYFLSQVAIDQDGSVYVLGSKPGGIEVRFGKAPK